MDAAEGESTHRSVQVQTNYSAAYLAVVYIRIREDVRFGIPEKSFIAFFCLETSEQNVRNPGDERATKRCYQEER